MYYRNAPTDDDDRTADRARDPKRDPRFRKREDGIRTARRVKYAAQGRKG